MPGGRPLRFNDPEELQTEIDLYFVETDKPTLAGLAYALGISRSTLYEYDSKDRFSDIIKNARERVEVVYEERLMYSPNPTGVIFALKNMGWADNAKVAHSSDEIKPFSWFVSQDHIMTIEGRQKES